MGISYGYYTYHQRKGHAKFFCKILEATILALIAQGKYQIDENASNPIHIVNIITVDKEVCVGLRRGCPHHVPNLVTME